MSMHQLRAQYLGKFAYYLKIGPREIDHMGITDFVALTRFLDYLIDALNGNPPNG